MVIIAMCIWQTHRWFILIVTNLVQVCKFFMLLTHHRMKGDEPIYQLSKETLEII